MIDFQPDFNEGEELDKAIYVRGLVLEHIMAFVIDERLVIGGAIWCTDLGILLSDGSMAALDNTP